MLLGTCKSGKAGTWGILLSKSEAPVEQGIEPRSATSSAQPLEVFGCKTGQPQLLHLEPGPMQSPWWAEMGYWMEFPKLGVWFLPGFRHEIGNEPTSWTPTDLGCLPGLVTAEQPWRDGTSAPKSFCGFGIQALPLSILNGSALPAHPYWCLIPVA